MNKRIEFSGTTEFVLFPKMMHSNAIMTNMRNLFFFKYEDHYRRFNNNKKRLHHPNVAELIVKSQAYCSVQIA